MRAQLSLNPRDGGSIEGAPAAVQGGWVGKAGGRRGLEDAGGAGGMRAHPETMVRRASFRGDGAMLSGMGLQDAVPYAGAVPVAP